MTKKPKKKIDTLEDLQQFVTAIIYAHGSDISSVEAEIAIRKAFEEFRFNFENSYRKMLGEFG